jgi:organic radical activating enzyme
VNVKAKITEIFHSLQGEGIYLGEPTTFVRLAGCNLDCVYCDTPQAKDESKAGELDETEVIDRILAITRPEEMVSFTGGEPLLWAEFIKGIAPKLKEKGFRAYLETNGTLPQALAPIIDHVDIISMDIKPPSGCGKDLWNAQRDFLNIARGKAFVKMVVCDDTTKDEVEKTARLISGIDKKIILILQPAEGHHAPDMQTVRKFQALAGGYLDHVSIIRQMHKIWNVR